MTIRSDSMPLNGDEKDKMLDHFIRHFAIEATKMLGDAERITLFRELSNSQQLNCFVQGTMIAMTSIVRSNLDVNSVNAAGFTVRHMTIDYMTEQVVLGIENGEVLAGELFDIIERVGRSEKGK